MPHALAFTANGELFFGTMDRTQKLHVVTHRLDHEYARRIAYQPSTQSFGIVTIHIDTNANGDVVESSWFKVLDDQTFEGKVPWPFVQCVCC
jgi:DNA damage-binding protein 1